MRRPWSRRDDDDGVRGLGIHGSPMANSGERRGTGSSLSNAVVGVVLGCILVIGYSVISGDKVVNVDISSVGLAAGLGFGGDEHSHHARAGERHHGHGDASVFERDGADGTDEDANPPPANVGARIKDGACKCARHCLHVSCRKISVEDEDDDPAADASVKTMNASNAPPPDATFISEMPQPIAKRHKGHMGEREKNLLTQSLAFGRCKPETCSRAPPAGECVAQSLATEPERCSPPQRHIANHVRKCLIPSLLPPHAFTLERDSTSGFDIVCRGDLSIEVCRTLDAAGRDQYEEMSEMMRMLLAHSDRGAAFLDFGNTDALLDLRMAAIPNVSVTVLSANPEQRNVAQLTACLNELPPNRFTASRYNLSFTGRRNRRILVDHVPGRPLIIRVNAPGYEDSVTAELLTTIQNAQPAIILTTGDQKILAEWFMTMEYVAFNPKTCRFANNAEQVGRIGLAASRKTSAYWVTEKTRGILVPRCTDACLVPSCEEEWRTQYRACYKHEERCTGDDFEEPSERRLVDGCYWKTQTTACKKDSNWMKVMKCADPALPVATFSIVDVRGLLLACRGERDCAGVDNKVHDFTLNLLSSFFHQIQDSHRYTPEYVAIGSFVGNVGFAIAKQNIEVHMFEPVPTSRQWLKISQCLNGLPVKLYDHGIGPADEDCTIPPTAEALNGPINVTCPAPPASQRFRDRLHAHDTVVPFRTLNTVLRHWKFENHNRPAGNKGFVVHFDDTLDVLPLLQSADKWLSDPEWKPAIVIMSGQVPRAKKINTLLLQHDYQKANVEGSGAASYRIYVASSNGRKAGKNQLPPPDNQDGGNVDPGDE
jgi:hypothetical protein